MSGPTLARTAGGLLLGLVASVSRASGGLPGQPSSGGSRGWRLTTYFTVESC